VKKHGFETCAECEEVFGCPIFVRRKVVEWIPAGDNLRQIKQIGTRAWLREQKARQALLERLLQNYNEGRSMTLYCKVCARMPVDSIGAATRRAEDKLAGEAVDASDLKSKAKILRAVFKDAASKANINLD
jgi:hypothetical protein